MMKQKISIYLLLAALLPAIAMTMATQKANARDGRNAAFATGLIAGAVGGAAIMANDRYYNPPRRYYRPAPPPPRYYRPAPPRYYRPVAPRYYRPAPPPRYYGRPAPWTPEWYSYCHSKYRSFNPRTGYFTTYGGRQRFCR